MEENKKNEEKKAAKLSYEELENAAKQISVQADALYKENIQLKQALQQANLSNMFTELSFKFKTLEYANMFDPDFIGEMITGIQDTMTPVKEKEEEKQEDGEKED